MTSFHPVTPSKRLAAIAYMQQMKPRSHARIRQERRVKELATAELAEQTGKPVRLTSDVVVDAREKIIHQEMQRKARRRFGLVLITALASAFAAGAALGTIL